MKPAPTYLTKSVILAHQACARRAWLMARSDVAQDVSAEVDMLRKQGIATQDAYRSTLSGVLVNPMQRVGDAALETGWLIDAGIPRLFEAGIAGAGVGVRVDVLDVEADGVTITEVKAAASVKDEYLMDCAVQVFACEAAGLTVKAVKVAHLNSSAELPADGNVAAVFSLADVKAAVQDRVPLVARMVEGCAQTIAADAEPQVSCGEQCFEDGACVYAAHCGAVQEKPEFDGTIPNKRVNADRMALMIEAIDSLHTVIRPEFAWEIRNLAYPRRFLDFETVGPAVPLFPGMKPFEPLTFQWSLHTVAARGDAPAHDEFLSVEPTDPRRAFAESLIEHCGKVGPILVYSHFERDRLKALCRFYPDLADALRGIMGRLVDLLPMARRGYYDPRMLGSWSIKAISPTLPKRKDVYAQLKAHGGIGDGMAAQAVYLEAIDPMTAPERREEIRQHLSDYCATDTIELIEFADYVETGKGLPSFPNGWQLLAA